MSNELPEPFDKLSPQAALRPLRARVLAAVDRALADSSNTSPKRERGFLKQPNVGEAAEEPSLTLRASESADAMPGGVQGVAIASAAGATAGLSSSADPESGQYGQTARWDRWAAWSVAAALALGVSLHWASWRTGKRLGAMYGPAPLPAAVADIVREVESVAGSEGGRWMAKRLTAGRTTRSRDRRNKNGQPSAWPLTEPFTYQVSSLP